MQASTVSIALCATKHARVQSHCFTNEPEGLARIYEPAVNVAVWQRTFDEPMYQFMDSLSESHRFDIAEERSRRQLSMKSLLNQVGDGSLPRRWIDDLDCLLRLYVDLFGAQKVGVRLQTIDEAMCPRFHVDFTACRMLCSYSGAGTEIVANEAVMRGPSSMPVLGVSPRARPKRLPRFSVALLKGEAWAGNEGNGAVHRSPAFVSTSKRRVLFSVDALS